MYTVAQKSGSATASRAVANIQRKAAQSPVATGKDSVRDMNTFGNHLQGIIKSGCHLRTVTSIPAQSPPSFFSVQPKLTVGEPGDKFEQEANETADKVLTMPSLSADSVNEEEPAVQAKPLAKNISGFVQPQPEEEEPVQTQPEEEEPSIQKQSEEEEPVVQAQKEEEEVQAQLKEEEPVQRQREEEPEIQAQPEEEVRRQSSAAAASPGASFEHTLSTTKGSGDPLPVSVRSYMEHQFGADFSNVKIHTGPDAVQMNREIHSRAFTHGSDLYFNEGNFDPGTSSGKHLIAHELTHTVQQRAAVQTQPGIHTKSSSGTTIQRSWLGDAWNTVSGAVGSAAEWVGDNLEAGKDWLLDRIKDLIEDVPGYKLFTVVLGEDPITNRPVPRNGRNFIEAGLDIIPFGNDYKRKLEQEDKLDEAAAWVDNQIKQLDFSPTQIARDFTRFWDSLSLSDIGNPRGVLRRLLNIFSGPMNRIIRFTRNVATKFLEIVKDAVLTQVVDFIKEQTNAFPLLTVILGRNPVTGEEVERSGANILRGFINLHPDGEEQLRQMQETGSFLRAANWIDTSIIRVRNAALGLRDAFANIWTTVSIHSLLEPIATFRRIYNQFRQPVGEILSFMWEVGSMILRFIKDALLRRLTAYARGIRGYPLITVILGQDPFTGEQVERSVENIIRGFMSLMENGEEQFNQLKESGAIERTTSWLNGAIERLGITWEYITGLFRTAWESLSLSDLARPFEVFAGIMRSFAAPIGRLFNFVIEVIKKIIEIILQIMRFPTDLVISIFEKTVSVFNEIKRDPVGFIKNLLRGVKQGFVQFFDNIGTHLLNGLTGWLFGELQEAGITPPPDLSFRSILGLVMEVLGITAERIFEKIGERIGHERMERIRGMTDRIQGVWSFVRDVIERGPVAIWERIQEQLSNLWDMVLDRIKEWVMERIITRVVTKLLSMLDPTGVMAVVNSFIAFYNAIESFIAYFRRILEMVNRFVDGVAAVARGNIAPAADKLEESMARGMPIAIGFLANQVGLGGLGRRVGEMIAALRGRVDRALDWLIDMAMRAGGAVLNMARSAAGTVGGAIRNLFGGRTRFRTGSGEAHSIYVEERGGRPQLIIASTPQLISEFLDFYENERGSNLTDTQRQHLSNARNQVTNEINPVIQRLLSAQQAAQSEDHIQTIQQELLDKEAQLANLLRLLLSGDRNIGQLVEKYALEGLSGTFGTMPKPPGDDFTADHQPQAAILEEAARMSWFREEGIENMRNRAAGRARAGYAINLHKNRHEAGRTYGGKGRATKNQFMDAVRNQTTSQKTAAENRRIVVNLIKQDLAKDVAELKAVINSGNNNENWQDINQETNLPREQKNNLINDLRNRISRGEDRLAAQDVDSLAN